MKGLVIGSTISVALAGLVAWFFWGPVWHFFLSMIPATAAYAWVGKIFVTILVAYFGGIGLPLVILVGGIGATLTLCK